MNLIFHSIWRSSLQSFSGSWQSCSLRRISQTVHSQITLPLLCSWIRFPLSQGFQDLSNETVFFTHDRIRGRWTNGHLYSWSMTTWKSSASCSQAGQSSQRKMSPICEKCWWPCELGQGLPLRSCRQHWWRICFLVHQDLLMNLKNLGVCEFTHGLLYFYREWSQCFCPWQHLIVPLESKHHSKRTCPFHLRTFNFSAWVTCWCLWH